MAKPKTIKGRLAATLNRTLRPLGISIVRRTHGTQLREGARPASIHSVVKLVTSCPPENAYRSIELLPQAQGQLLQDIFVLNCLGFKRSGFFVEFGATDGKTLSNTWLLEKAFDWTGILAEPAKSWHAALAQERSCSICTECVWQKTGEKLAFRETTVGEFSTIDAIRNADLHAAKRHDGITYQVETISLNDLLERYQAPPVIDYISIDTEGSEYKILECFDFDRHTFRVITVEHNYNEQRAKIRSLLEGHGYVHVLEEISRFDDWYVHADIAVRFQTEASRL